MSRKYLSYEELLNYALEEADTFSVTWRNIAFEQSAFDILEKLSPWLVSDFSSSSWPGTELSTDRARVKTYKVAPESIQMLRCVSSVFEWLAPDYPEDLAFYQGKNVLFGSVAHEGDAWFTT